MENLTVHQAVALKWLMKAAFNAGQEYPNSKMEDHLVWDEKEEIFYMIADGHDQEKFAEAKRLHLQVEFKESFIVF